MPKRDDDVDELVRLWSRLLPDVDASPLDVMSRLRRAAHSLRVLRAASFRKAGLDAWEFDVLSALRKAGDEELPVSALTTATMVSTATMSTRLRLLEGRGVIERRPNPDDARSTLVALTASGAAAVDTAMRELIVAEHRALEPLSPADRTELARLLRMLLAPRS